MGGIDFELLYRKWLCHVFEGLQWAVHSYNSFCLTRAFSEFNRQEFLKRNIEYQKEYQITITQVY